MAKRTGPTNPVLNNLITELKRLAIKKEMPLYKRLATELSKSTRQRRRVNLSRINRNIKEGEIAIVPGKLLGAGNMANKNQVVAWDISETAKSKLGEKQFTYLHDFIKKDLKGKKVRIIA